MLRDPVPMDGSDCFAVTRVIAELWHERSDTLWTSELVVSNDLWRRRLVFPVAIGCEPGQVRKEAAAAALSGAGVGLAGAVSNYPLIYSDRKIAAFQLGTE